MEFKRYILRPLSPWGSPLPSDTLTGLILCRIAEEMGDSVCEETISAFRNGDPPFILSSIMPYGKIFQPILPPIGRENFRSWVEKDDVRDKEKKKLSLFEALNAQKKFRKNAYLPVDVWVKYARNLSLKALFRWYCSNIFMSRQMTEKEKRDEARKKKEMAGVEPHVSIDRMSGCALTGGLFFNRLSWYAKDAAFHLYAKAKKPDELLSLLQHVGDLGFGKDASTGKGRFSVEEDVSFDPKIFENDGECSLLCSVCASTDLSSMRGWYAVDSKRGKAGPSVSTPFKTPVILVREGSVLQSLPKGSYVLSGIHVDPRIVQITQPFTLPCHVEK